MLSSTAEVRRRPLGQRHLAADEIAHFVHARRGEPRDRAAVDEERRPLVAKARARGRVHAHQPVLGNLALLDPEVAAQAIEQREAPQHAVGDVVAEEDAVEPARPDREERIERRDAQDLGPWQVEACLDAVDRLRRDPAAFLLDFAQHLQQLVGIVPVPGHRRGGDSGCVRKPRKDGRHGLGTTVSHLPVRASRHTVHATPSRPVFLDADLMTRAFAGGRTVVPGAGVEPASLAAADFKSAAFTSFATRAAPPSVHAVRKCRP